MERATWTSRTVEELGSLEFGLARTLEEREAAFRLVHERYVARGYMHPDPSGRRTGPHHVLDTTQVFIGRDADRVVATVSVIPDSPFGLPCDELYRDELVPLRANGRRLAEVSALAIDGGWRTVGFSIVRSLVQVVALYASRIASLDTLCIAVNPRHARFYVTLLGFEHFGGLKAYAAVNGAPALALRLDLDRPLAPPAAEAAAAFVPALFDPLERARMLAALQRDLHRPVQPFQSVPRPIEHFVGATVAEMC